MQMDIETKVTLCCDFEIERFEQKHSKKTVETESEVKYELNSEYGHAEGEDDTCVITVE